MATSKNIRSRRLAALRGSVDSSRQSLARALCFLDHVAKCCKHEGVEGDLPSLVEVSRRLGYTALGHIKAYETEKALLEQVGHSRRQLRELLAVVSAADAIRDSQWKWALCLENAVQDVTAAIERLDEEKILAWADHLTAAQAA